MESKYLDFNEVQPPKPRKTKIWSVCSKASSVELGQIKWHSQWRQYCFFPSSMTIFDRKCLTDIITFITYQMAMREAHKG